MPMKMTKGVLTALDIYGHPINVLYKGDPVYRTRLGSLFTLVTYILILVNFGALMKQWVDKSN